MILLSNTHYWMLCVGMWLCGAFGGWGVRGIVDGTAWPWLQW